MPNRLELEPFPNFPQRIEPEFRVPFSLWFLEASTIKFEEEHLHSSAFAKDPSCKVQCSVSLAEEGLNKAELMLLFLRRSETADIVTEHTGYNFDFSKKQNGFTIKAGEFVLTQPSLFKGAFRHNIGNSLSAVSVFPWMVDKFSGSDDSKIEAELIRNSFLIINNLLNLLSQAEKIEMTVEEDKIGVAFPPLCSCPIFITRADKPSSHIAA